MLFRVWRETVVHETQPWPSQIPPTAWGNKQLAKYLSRHDIYNTNDILSMVIGVTRTMGSSEGGALKGLVTADSLQSQGVSSSGPIWKPQHVCLLPFGLENSALWTGWAVLSHGHCPVRGRSSVASLASALPAVMASSVPSYFPACP